MLCQKVLIFFLLDIIKNSGFRGLIYSQWTTFISMLTNFRVLYEIKDTKESSTSASYLDILLKVDINGKLTTQLYDKRDDFSFSIVNFPHLCSNIPLSPAYGVYISQLIRYARACSGYSQFLNRGKLLTNKLMVQGFQQSRLKSAFRKFYGRYNDLVRQYNIALGQMLSDMFHTDC